MRALARPAAPPARARRLAWRDAPYVALDFETTGLDHRSDTIVSFGAVPVQDGRVRMAGAIGQLIEPHVPPSPRSQTIHELRPQDLAGSPRLAEAAGILREALAERFLLVWFAPVEMSFLRGIFGGRSRTWRRRTIDVRSLAIAAEGAPATARNAPGYALSGTARRHGVPVDNPHDALDDALVTAQLFLVLVRKLPGLDRPTVADLSRLGRPPD